MKRHAIGLGARLGKRLRPLALATGLVVSVGAPLTYFALEHQNLAHHATTSASLLADALGDHPLHQVIAELLRGEPVAVVRVVDGAGIVRQRWAPVDAPLGWIDTYAPTGRATRATSGSESRTVIVTLSQRRLVAITAALLVLSTAVGVAVALAIALYPVRVVRGMEERIDDLITRQERLLDASRVLASTLDLREVLDRLAGIAVSLPGIDVVRIWLVDEASGVLVMHAQTGVRRLDVEHALALEHGRGVTAAVVESGAPLVIRDALADRRLVNAEWFRAEGLVSYLGVPLKAGDSVLGALACMSRAPRDWTRTEVALAETLGTLAAVAIENARNFGELTRRGDRLRRVADLARAVSGSLDLDAVLQQVTSAVLAIRADLVCFIRLVDHQAHGYPLAAVGGVPETRPVPFLPFGEGLTHAVAETRQPLFLKDPGSDPRTPPRTRTALGARAYYGVPIQAGETLVGVLNVSFPPGVEPTAAEREAIDLFAGQAAIAIGNAQLFGESETRRRAAEALANVGRVLAQALDAHGVAQRVADSVCTLLGTAGSALYRVHPETGDLHGIALAGAAASVVDDSTVFPRGTGAAAIALATRRPATSADVLTDPRIMLSPDVRARIERANYRAVLAAPLIVKERLIGVLAAGDRAGRVFNADEIALAQAFADQAGIALENARLYEEARRRQHEAEELARVARSFTETLDLRNVGERIVASVLPLCSVRSSALCLVQADRSLRPVAWGGVSREHFSAEQVFPPGSGVMGRAVMLDAPVQSRDVFADPEVVLPDDLRAHYVNAAVRSVLAVPLHAKGELVAVLSIADSTVRDFTADDVALLQTFGDQAALALDNARLYANAQHAVDELSQAQAQLVRGETLRAMGELASGVAHHLNNLLAVVLGRLQLARASNPPADIERHLRLAERAAVDGAEVVRRMRGFSRGHPTGELAPVDLNRIAEEVIELTRPRWQDEAHVRGVRIDAQLLAGDVPAAPGEMSALREVLMNLILNAVDAMPNGGTILVRTWSTADAVYCEVGDTGVGMSPEVQRRAIEPFFTTKGFQSTGLGLSVNYGIIRRHGGDMTIDSVVDGGTRVRFSLPLVTPPRTSPRPIDSVPAISPLRILVIDDEGEVRRVVTDMLAEQGHEVVEASAGADGLAHLDHGERFDLVLTDLGMPGMTGWDVARAAKAKRPSIRVGLITGWGEQPSAKPEDRAAADFVIAKPITIDGLRAALSGMRPPAS